MHKKTGIKIPVTKKSIVSA